MLFDSNFLSFRRVQSITVIFKTGEGNVTLVGERVLERHFEKIKKGGTWPPFLIFSSIDYTHFTW